jgi:hypothetical protein
MAFHTAVLLAELSPAKGLELQRVHYNVPKIPPPVGVGHVNQIVVDGLKVNSSRLI